jgi:copper homeostasis protein (lipoprotein)
LLISLDGQVAMRPKRQGGGRQATLVVERFTGVWPAEGCGSRISTEPLENTCWKLTRVGTTPVVVVAQQREAHFILDPTTRRVRGSGGCNRLTGSNEVNGDQLTFGQMAGTMMACPDGMETEKAFLGALSQANKVRITRQHLDLLDSAGNLVARFEARHMK